MSQSLSHHKTDEGEAEEGQRLASATFPVLGETPTAVEPCDGSLDDPALGQHRKACRLIRALDDLDLDPATDPAQARLEGGALVSAIRVELEQEGMQAKQRRHHPHATIAILHVGWMHEGVQQ